MVDNSMNNPDSKPELSKPDKVVYKLRLVDESSAWCVIPTEAIKFRKKLKTLLKDADDIIIDMNNVKCLTQEFIWEAFYNLPELKIQRVLDVIRFIRIDDGMRYLVKTQRKRARQTFKK